MRILKIGQISEEQATLNDNFLHYMRKASLRETEVIYRAFFGYDLIENLSKMISIRALDVAGGKGMLLKGLQEKFGVRTKELVNIDLEPVAQSGITSIQADFLNEDIKIRKNFNYINCKAGIGYMNDGLKALQKIANGLSKNGFATIYCFRKEVVVSKDFYKIIKELSELNKESYKIRYIERDPEKNSNSIYCKVPILIIIKRTGNRYFKNPYKAVIKKKGLKVTQQEEENMKEIVNVKYLNEKRRFEKELYFTEYAKE